MFKAVTMKENALTQPILGDYENYSREYYENYNAKGVIICQIKIFSRLFVIFTRSNNRIKMAHISQL